MAKTFYPLLIAKEMSHRSMLIRYTLEPNRYLLNPRSVESLVNNTVPLCLVWVSCMCLDCVKCFTCIIPPPKKKPSVSVGSLEYPPQIRELNVKEGKPLGWLSWAQEACVQPMSPPCHYPASSGLTWHQEHDTYQECSGNAGLFCLFAVRMAFVCPGLRLKEPQGMEKMNVFQILKPYSTINYA